MIPHLPKSTSLPHIPSPSTSPASLLNLPCPVIDPCEEVCFTPLETVGMEGLAKILASKHELSCRSCTLVDIFGRSPVQSRSYSVAPIGIAFWIVASGLSNVNLAASRPTAVCFSFWIHPIQNQWTFTNER